MDSPPPAPAAGKAAHNAKLVASIIVGLLPLLAPAADIHRLQGAGLTGDCRRRPITNLSPGKVLEALVLSGPSFGRRVW